MFILLGTTVTEEALSRFLYKYALMLLSTSTQPRYLSER